MSSFLRKVLKRLGVMLVTLVAMSLLIFVLVEMMPGDVAQMVLGQSVTPEALSALRESMGLNDPFHLRYLRWFR